MATQLITLGATLHMKVVTPEGIEPQNSILENVEVIGNMPERRVLNAKIKLSKENDTNVSMFIVCRFCMATGQTNKHIHTYICCTIVVSNDKFVNQEVNYKIVLSGTINNAEHLTIHKNTYVEEYRAALDTITKKCEQYKRALHAITEQIPSTNTIHKLRTSAGAANHGNPIMFNTIRTDDTYYVQHNAHVVSASSNAQFPVPSVRSRAVPININMPSLHPSASCSIALHPTTAKKLQEEKKKSTKRTAPFMESEPIVLKDSDDESPPPKRLKQKKLAEEKKKTELETAK